MKKIIGMFLVFCISVNSVFANIYISEIMPNTTDDSNLEYIELGNSGNQKINLKGYKLKDKSNKEFDFGYGDYIDTNNSQKYYRSKTKIILNNTNEKIFLYDNSGTLIDNFSYSSSIKGQAIVVNNNIITSSGTTNSGSTTNSGNTIDIPEINFYFQNPSYLLNKNNSKTDFYCDQTKIECKVNLDLRNSFGGEFKESDYICKIDFGLKGWYTGEENKCNPNTITFPKGIFDVNIEIISKSNLDNKKSKKIKIINKEQSQIIYKTNTVYKDKIIEKEICHSNNSNTKNSYENNSNIKIPNTNKNNTSHNINKIIIFPPKIEIQSGIKNGICTKTECKINLIYKQKSSKESCLWFFGDGNFKTKDTNKKCNPGYVNYPLGKHKIYLKVFEKNNPNNFKISSLSFSNISTIQQKQINLKSEDKNNFNNLKIDNQVDNNIDNQEHIIDIKLNIPDFDEKKQVDIIDNSIDKKGKKLIYSQNKNSQIVYFTDNIISEKINFKNKYSQEVKIIPLDTKIIIQGKIGKNKKLKNNILSCYGSCSVNFNINKSSQNIKKYHWDFGNKQTYDGINPPYIKYKKFGKYKVTLNLTNKQGKITTKIFFVNFYPKLKIAKTSKKKKSKKLSNNKTLKKKYKSSYLIASQENCKSFFPKIPKDFSRLQNFIYFLLFIIFLLMGHIILQKRKLI